MTVPRIPFARPTFGPEASAAIARVLESGWVTQGPEVAAFEREVAVYVGSPHACAVSSGTSALHLSLLAAGVHAGDEVITVSHSFIAPANAVRYCGATPVFVDIEPATFNIDPARVASAVTSRTRAILCVHQLGLPCDLTSLLEIARRLGLMLIEDAACAIGSEILRGDKWERIGRPHGDAACFSFHPRKLLTTGDGGMMTTARPEWDAAFRRWRQHGMDLPDLARHAASTVVVERYLDLGFNYRMTDLQAAVGRTQLAALDSMLARRREQAEHYRESLEDIAGLGLPSERPGVHTNWQSYCVTLPEEADVREVMQTLLDHGIASRPGVMNIHEQPAYPAGSWRMSGGLAVAERARRRGLMLPLFHALSPADQGDIAAVLRHALVDS